MLVFNKYTLVFLQLFVGMYFYAQDKVVFKNGNVINCKIIINSENTLSYKNTSINDSLITVLKAELLLAEYKNGDIYIFGPSKTTLQQSNVEEFNMKAERNANKLKEWEKAEQLMPNGILGFYPVQIFAGRFTVSYERLFANKTMGIVVPISLTYDVIGILNATSTNTNSINYRPAEKGVGIIAGIDLNYYHTLKSELKYFFGPRVKYGSAKSFGGIEFLSVQIQNGLMKSKGKKFTNSIAVGFGFFKLSKQYNNTFVYDLDEVFPSGSITWRLGFRL